jgi:hypothetical protein
MEKFYKWIKFGNNLVYEGKHSVIFGDDKYGYNVFATKKELKLLDDGSVDYTTRNGKFGAYRTKKEALKVFKTLEKAFDSGKFIQTAQKTTNDDAFTIAFNSRKGMGGVIIYDPNHPEDLIHEQAHISLGHLKPSCDKSKLQKEKEATALEIKILKRKGQYNQNIRNRSVRKLATYMKGNRKRASKVISQISTY